jgi:hypothetical protein
MDRFGWAALCAAGALACAGQADATVVTMTVGGEYIGVSGPAGSLGPASDFHWPYQVFSNYGGRDHVTYDVGGYGWGTILTFDTSLGVLSETGGSFPVETLSWDAAMGTPSPLLSGTYYGLGGERDLTDATSFSVYFAPWGPGFSVSGPGYTLDDQLDRYFGPYLTGNLTTPLSLSLVAAPDYGGGYHSALFDGGGSVLFNVSLSPAPEPATWALMLTGFFGLGAALRRRRPLGYMGLHGGGEEDRGRA